jgi:hypothetical protein
MGCDIGGTIEVFPTALHVYGALRGLRARFTFGEIQNTRAERIRLEDRGEGAITDSDIIFNDAAIPNRPLLTCAAASADSRVSCYIRNTTIRSNAGKQFVYLPENVKWNPNTGYVTLNGVAGTDRPYQYWIGDHRDVVDIPLTTVWRSGGISEAEVVRFIAPTPGGPSNVLAATVRVRGLVFSSGAATSMSARYVDAVQTIAVNHEGALSLSETTDSPGIEGTVVNTDRNRGNISKVTLKQVIDGRRLKIILALERAAGKEPLQFSGTAEMFWQGNGARAPMLELP